MGLFNYLMTSVGDPKPDVDAAQLASPADTLQALRATMPPAWRLGELAPGALRGCQQGQHDPGDEVWAARYGQTLVVDLGLAGPDDIDAYDGLNPMLDVAHVFFENTGETAIVCVRSRGRWRKVVVSAMSGEVEHSEGDELPFEAPLREQVEAEHQRWVADTGLPLAWPYMIVSDSFAEAAFEWATGRSRWAGTPNSVEHLPGYAFRLPH